MITFKTEPNLSSMVISSHGEKTEILRRALLVA